MDEELAGSVAEALAGRSIATAESCTAGRISTGLACVAGAVDFLRGGIVAYQEQSKREWLGVTAASVLSEEAAAEMAAGVCRALGADVGVATTGLAGDRPVAGVEPGTVFIGTCVEGRARARTHHFEGRPEAVCEAAARQALVDLLEQLGG